MYDAFYGFTAEPFRLSPDAHFCFRHRSFAKAKSYFNYALHHGEGFVLVTGRPGTGKTTLIEDLLKDLSNTGILTVRVDSAQVQADDLLRRVAYAFGLEGSGVDKATLLHRLEHYLHQRVRENGKALLVVDEAQTLPADALEELRLITNLTNYGRPLVQIFLVGQEALRDLISDPALEQLHQRILCACHLNPLPLQEMRDYLAHRLQCAGWRGDPVIETGAIRAMHSGSGGIPRLINKLADRLLLHGGLEEKHVLTAADAEYVLHELRAELLLKEEPVPAGNDEAPEIQIEAIRLQVPITPVSGSEVGQPLDQSPDDAPVQSGRDDNKAQEPSDITDATSTTDTTALDDPREPPMVVEPRSQAPQEPPEEAVRTPSTFTEVFPPEEGLLREPAIGGIGEGAPARVQPSKGRDTGGAIPAQQDRFGHVLANKASQHRSMHRWKSRIRRSGKLGVALAVFLLMVLGAGLFFLGGEGTGPTDGVAGFWSATHDRVGQVFGQQLQNRGQVVIAPKVPEQGAMTGLEVRDSAQESVAALSASLIPQSEMQASETISVDPPIAELSPLPSESAEPEPGSVVSNDIVSDSGPEADPNGSVGGIPRVSIASGERTASEPELRVDGTSPGIVSSGGSGNPNSVEDVSEPEVMPPLGTEPAESRFEDVVEAVQALGIDTESVGPNQIRLILRKAVAFGFDSARVPASAHEVLDGLSSVFVQHGEVRARIIGHTDHLGGARYNRRLSARRAAAIERYMVSRGVAADRLNSSGRGEDEPLVPQLSEQNELSREERLANRRIEIWIESFGGN